MGKYLYFKDRSVFGWKYKIANDVLDMVIPLLERENIFLRPITYQEYKAITKISVVIKTEEDVDKYWVRAKVN